MRPVWNVHLDEDGPEPTLTLPARLRAAEIYAAIVTWATDNDREWTTATAEHSVDGTIYYFERTAAP